MMMDDDEGLVSAIQDSLVTSRYSRWRMYLTLLELCQKPNFRRDIVSRA